MLDFLLERGAPLEVLNDYGGTPLDTLAFLAGNQPQPAVDYAAMAERLREHGPTPDAFDFRTAFPAPVDEKALG